MCAICSRILDLCGVTTQFAWRTAETLCSSHDDSVLEDLCKTLSGLELRAYLGGSSGSDHVITTNDIDDEKELELLRSPSKMTGKDSDLNKMATQSLKHSFIENDHHLENSLEDVNTKAIVNKIKVYTYIALYVYLYMR